MNNLTPYSEFLTEATLSSVSTFLKAQYNNIFKEPNQTLNNLFLTFTKKVDTEKNVAHLYETFVRASQTNMQNEINKAQTIDEVNKLVSDEVRYFYFSLKPIVNKLQNDEFTMEKIFERSRDKTLMKLMSYPEDQFSNAVQQYVNDSAMPWIKKDAGLDQAPQEKQQTQQPQQNTGTMANQTSSESMMHNIYKILEADTPASTPDADLLKYKQSAIKWLNISLFELLKPKFQLLNQLSANTTNTIDQLSKQMKGTLNDNAKKMILNKILNMDKEELQNLATSIGLKEEEIGKL